MYGRTIRYTMHRFCLCFIVIAIVNYVGDYHFYIVKPMKVHVRNKYNTI